MHTKLKWKNCNQVSWNYINFKINYLLIIPDIAVVFHWEKAQSTENFHIVKFSLKQVMISPNYAWNEQDAAIKTLSKS